MLIRFLSQHSESTIPHHKNSRSGPHRALPHSLELNTSFPAPSPTPVLKPTWQGRRLPVFHSLSREGKPKVNVCLLIFWDRISNSQAGFQTYCIAKAGLELQVLLHLPPVLRLQVCTTSPTFPKNLLQCLTSGSRELSTKRKRSCH